jgi:hypothetical protein
MSWTILLAQLEGDTAEPIDPGDVFTGRDEGPIQDWLEQQLGEGPLVSLLGGSIDVIAQVLLILAVGLVLLWLARRAIRRGVARAKDPDAPRGRGLRGRVGLAAAPETTSVRRAQRAEALGALATSIVGAS